MTLSDDQIRMQIDGNQKCISELGKNILPKEEVISLVLQLKQSINELKQDVKDSSFNLSLEVQFRKKLSARVTVLEEMINRMGGDGK